MQFRPVLFLIILSICGCDSNPYPEGAIKLFPQKAKRELRPSLSFDIPKEIEFTEGVLGDFPLQVSVPGNDPVIVLKNRPFASNVKHIMYVDKSDPDHLQIKWMPDYSAADDPKHPKRNWRKYTITVELFSKSHSEIATQFDIDFHVINKKREFRIVGTKSITLREGESLNEIYTVINKDFPYSVHDFDFTRDFKAHSHIIKYFNLMPNPDHLMKFHLTSAILPYNFLRHNDAEQLKKLFPQYAGTSSTNKQQPKYICNNRYGQEFKGCKIKAAILIKATDYTDSSAYYSINVDVRDTRADPFISMPQTVTKGRNINFIITSIDNNSEYMPRIHFKGSAGPIYGNLNCYNLNSKGERIELEDESDNSYPCTDLSNPIKIPSESDIAADNSFERRIEVSWTNIPESLLADNAHPPELTFDICTLGPRYATFTHCQQRTVSFDAGFTPPPGPVFIFNQENKTIYTKKYAPVTYRLKIRESDKLDRQSYITGITAQLTQPKTNGELFTTRISVSWDQAQEVIKFTAPNALGASTVEFTIEAQSRYQIDSSTTFSLNIETISDVLFIQSEDLQTDKQEISNDRMDQIASIVDKIIIDTPHLDKLPPGISQSLEDIGIKYEKDMLEGKDMSKRSFSLLTSPRLTAPRGNIYLADLVNDGPVPTMVYHDETHNPLLDVSCKQIFFISKTPQDPINLVNQMISSIPLGVRCDRVFEKGSASIKEKTTYIIIGFDYDKIQSDLVTDKNTIEGWKKRQLHYSTL